MMKQTILEEKNGWNRPQQDRFLSRFGRQQIQHIRFFR